MGDPFIPVEGQSFSSEQDWINRASRVLTRHPDYRNTEHGETKGWRGPHFTALCFDQAGNRMRNGGDFKRATNEGTYPVWWIWPDQIVPSLRRPQGGESMTKLAIIDYGHGVARLWGDLTKDSVERIFYAHAGQCFGIRKSISQCVVSSLKSEGFPKVFGVQPEHIAVVLKHNGDTIVWDSDGEKIKTEWD